MTLPLWRLTPAAELDDPRWLDHRPIPEVLVRARTAAEARVLASETSQSNSAGAVGNESANNHSRLLDEKLYRVDRADASAAAGMTDDAGDDVARVIRSGPPLAASPVRR